MRRWACVLSLASKNGEGDGIWPLSNGEGDPRMIRRGTDRGEQVGTPVT